MRIFEIASPIPTKSFAKLFHVGTMNISHKRRGSYEGSGLSVSLHPLAWMEIAEIDGPIWQCTRAGNRFIDFLRLTKPQKTMISDWAIKQGLAKRTTMWRVYYYDDEADEERYFSFTDKMAAEQEAHSFGEEMRPPIEIKGALTGTSALSSRMLQHHTVSDDIAGDLVTIAYAEDVMHIDGVWWNENLDVSLLSGPRGVIVPSMISHWQFSQIDSEELE